MSNMLQEMQMNEVMRLMQEVIIEAKEIRKLNEEICWKLDRITGMGEMGPSEK